jgi:Flavodoxin domain
MRVLVVYESMFGSTRRIAEAIGEGLTTEADGEVVGVADAPISFDGFDLVVVGGPTHAWSMSRPSTRRSTPMRVDKPDSGLVLEPGADTGPGVREWLNSVNPGNAKAAAFDTRLKSSALFTGRASKGIARQLTRHGLSMIAAPESFLVDKKSHLLPGELERARSWGAGLLSVVDQDRTRRS